MVAAHEGLRSIEPAAASDPGSSAGSEHSNPALSPGSEAQREIERGLAVARQGEVIDL